MTCWLVVDIEVCNIGTVKRIESRYMEIGTIRKSDTPVSLVATDVIVSRSSSSCQLHLNLAAFLSKPLCLRILSLDFLVHEVKLLSLSIRHHHSLAL
jgi:hypothetical protein